MTIENHFKKWLLENHPSLNKKFINRHSGENPTHLRLRPGCGFNSVEEMTKALDSLNIEYEFNNDYSRSPDYHGHGVTVVWNDSKIGMMLAVQKKGRVKRKSLSPKNLGLSGMKFSSVDEFETVIKQSIKGNDHFDQLVSMIDNVKNGVKVSKSNIKKEDIGRITSDFGEVLAAFKSVCQGKSIEFPGKSNFTVADFFENGDPVSVKNEKGGGKVNLSEYKDLINTETMVGKLLHSIASHNKNDFFKYAAQVSPLINQIAIMVGGTNIENVEAFVKKTSYNDFYSFIKNNKECKMLGIPDPVRPEELWNKGDTNPIYFTINTLLNRIWGRSKENGISDIVIEFLDKPKFVKVSIVNDNVVFEEKKFKSIKYWGTCYWSRATAAWHNWMGVEPIKE